MADEPDQPESGSGSKAPEEDAPSTDSNDSRTTASVDSVESGGGAKPSEEGSETNEVEEKTSGPPSSQSRTTEASQESKSPVEDTMSEFLKPSEQLKKATKVESLPLIAKLIGESLQEKPRKKSETEERAASDDSNTKEEQEEPKTPPKQPQSLPEQGQKAERTAANAPRDDERTTWMAQETLREVPKSKSPARSHPYEREDEFIRFRLFVQFPFFGLLTMVALFGTILDRAVGYLCNIVATESENVARGSTGLQQTILQYVCSASRVMSRQVIPLGKALRETSLEVVYFWLKYWKNLKLGRSGPVGIAVQITEAFSCLDKDKLAPEDKIESPQKSVTHEKQE